MPYSSLIRLATGILVATVAVAGTSMGGGAESASTADRPAGPPSAAPAHGAPIVIGYRGASGYRPEHTLASYRLAAHLGADFIEPDLVSTSDGVLVARHKNEISGTTDVADHPEFAARRTTKTVDGRQISGWFTEDFTLEELRTLRAVERIPELRPGNTAFDGLETIPTLQEVIDVARSEGVGIYPETKHPSYFDSIGLSLEEPLVATLEASGYDHRRHPVFIQSFETATEGRLQQPTSLVDDAHRRRLLVHLYTFRNENAFLPAELRRGDPVSEAFPRATGDAPAEYRLFYRLGVDGLFSDNPDTAVASRGAALRTWSWLQTIRRSA